VDGPAGLCLKFGRHTAGLGYYGRRHVARGCAGLPRSDSIIAVRNSVRIGTRRTFTVSASQPRDRPARVPTCSHRTALSRAFARQSFPSLQFSVRPYQSPHRTASDQALPFRAGVWPMMGSESTSALTGAVLRFGAWCVSGDYTL
jgi:hypothetical protein